MAPPQMKFPCPFPNLQRRLVDRLSGTDILPPTTHPEIGVQSKDVVVSPETGLSDSRFLPSQNHRLQPQKTPLPPFLTQQCIHYRVITTMVPHSPPRQTSSLQNWERLELLKGTEEERVEWGGSTEIVETEDEDHAFHLFNPASDKASALVDISRATMTTQADTEIAHRFRFFQVQKDGLIVLFDPPVEKILPSDDPSTGSRSKDVVISSDPPVSARIFLPKSAESDRRLPLLIYVHGGAFCMESAFSPTYHNFVGNVVTEANVVAVSVDAGANITHTLAYRVGSNGLEGVKLVGSILVHPFFGGTEDDYMWMYMFPENKGLKDPRLKPGIEDLAGLGCERVLVFLAEKDHLLEVGKTYVEDLKKSGWGGTLEIVETVGEEHCFHLFKPKSVKALNLVNKFVSFLKQV
ncbi:hypothetical protein FNV43_RR22468 [Rhamnella rubrinervis]|uniref:Alpha/beta hydrolase fold-3 domain-containing protein n=1 Tax=Rhamnella rubrinervis TaxID=2594499 RepID=A0A8K0DWN9_9ROSA|nr:hypothetical protein FNV43_RR22468 [Rhamnella rubrinervis]